MTKHHGMTALKGIAAHCRMGRESSRDDRFGRLFPNLAPVFTRPDILQFVGRQGGPMDGGTTADRTDSVPVGHVFFGQFVDHDITLDVTSSFNRVNEPAETPNLRTPTLDLDCIYGPGPEDAPFMYVQEGDFEGIKLLTGADEPPSGDADADLLRANDLLRSPNGRAIIGDHRNDENRIISQIQLAFINFHNAMADVAKAEYPNLSGGALFEEARRLTTWHYQWGLVHDFLVSMCGEGIVNDILANGRQFYCPTEPQIPIEFAVAAYRFGHSMAPMKIQVQKGDTAFELFGQKLGRGFSPLTDQRAIVDWRELMFVPDKTGVQRAEKMDTKMATDLLKLPFISADDEQSLATRNLLRSNSFLLPGGDRVALEMGRSEAEVDTVMSLIATLSDDKITEGAPLWLYILAEAEAIGRLDANDQGEQGEGLGPVGGRIVAEVLIGLIELDEHSWLGSDRNWTPMDDFNSIQKIVVSQNSSVHPA
ncbi:MAG: heme peroxidase family protein [Pseudomonadota bacterium]